MKLQNIMGKVLSICRSKKGQRFEEIQKILQKSQEATQIQESKKAQALPERPTIKRQPTPSLQIKAVLALKKIDQNSTKSIDRNSPLVQRLEADSWTVDPQIIEHYRINNIFQMIEESPALTLQLTLVGQLTYLIGNAKRLQLQREKVEKQEGESQKQLGREYAIIYADLFSIKFSILRKIKLKGPNKKSQGAIVSLEPIASIKAPLLEQFTADDHPITNLRFLRRCIWPFLAKLSLRNNNISDSYEIAKVLPTLASVLHIEGIDLAGELSNNWMQVGWICKMGFSDAQKERDLLQSDEEYRHKYSNKVLRRIDCSMHEKKLVRAHIAMIKNKFNNPYFDNPITIW